MPKKIILKNRKNSFARKIIKYEKLRKWPKKDQKWPFFGPGGPNFDPFFTFFFFSNQFKYAQIHINNKKSEKFIHWKNFKVKKL